MSQIPIEYNGTNYILEKSGELEIDDMKLKIIKRGDAEYLEFAHSDDMRVFILVIPGNVLDLTLRSTPTKLIIERPLVYKWSDKITGIRIRRGS